MLSSLRFQVVSISIYVFINKEEYNFLSNAISLALVLCCSMILDLERLYKSSLYSQQFWERQERSQTWLILSLSRLYCIIVSILCWKWWNWDCHSQGSFLVVCHESAIVEWISLLEVWSYLTYWYVIDFFTSLLKLIQSV